MPNAIYWIATAMPHRIAIVARPLLDNWLADYIQRLSRKGIQVLVSMLTPEESAELGLSEEERLCDHCGISYFDSPSRIALFLTKTKSQNS